MNIVPDNSQQMQLTTVYHLHMKEIPSQGNSPFELHKLLA